MSKTYILNVSGGHGHFLQWVLDKFCVSTPPIDKLPYNEIGASHVSYDKSGKFIFIDMPETKNFLSTNTDKNAIMITIEDEILYWERSCIYRAGNAGSDLFSEVEIAKFLRENQSKFPDYCESKNISIKEGYMYGFYNLDECGARVLDKERKSYPGIAKNNIYFFPLKNFINKENFKKALVDVGERFGFKLDLSNFSETYDVWYNQNTILQTYDAVEQYQNGNTSVKLDVLQQAYVDAQKK